MELQISNSIAELLTKLAEERGLSPDGLLTILITEYDQNKHVIWSPRQQQHVRVKCGHANCFETLDRKDLAGGYRD